MSYSDLENQRLTTNFSDLEDERLENNYTIFRCFNRTIYIGRFWLYLCLILFIIGLIIELIYIFINYYRL
jgi:hypothetical protein